MNFGSSIGLGNIKENFVLKTRKKYRNIKGNTEIKTGTNLGNIKKTIMLKTRKK